MNSLESIHTYDIRKQKQKRNKRLEVLLEKMAAAKTRLSANLRLNWS